MTLYHYNYVGVFNICPTVSRLPFRVVLTVRMSSPGLLFFRLHPSCHPLACHLSYALRSSNLPLRSSDHLLHGVCLHLYMCVVRSCFTSRMFFKNLALPRRHCIVHTLPFSAVNDLHACNVLMFKPQAQVDLPYRLSPYSAPQGLQK